MPKFKTKSFPKQPKGNASIETWKAYAAKKRAVNKENSKILSEKRKYESVKRIAKAIKPVRAKK